VKPPCKRHELAGLTEECFCPEPVGPSEAVVIWSYGTRWGSSVAICTVTLGGRSEQWASKSIYITDDERSGVPKMLEDKIKATIRLFGEILEDYSDDDGD
jgi:hypothetical protein